MPNVTILSLPETRPVLVHYHIFKNAGTSFCWSLARQFPGQFATVDGPNPGAFLNGDDLTGFLEAHPHIRAVSSHHFNYPNPSTRSLAIYDCCFLRHPLRRLQSVYAFLAKQTSDDPVCHFARTQSIDGFLRTLVSKRPHLVSNVQTAVIAGRDSFRLPVTRAQLQIAMRRLQEMSVPGLVELYDQSLVLAEYFLQPEFSAIQFEYVAQNVTSTSADALSGSLEELREDWGSKLFREIAALNELDIELYQSAAKEIGRRSALVPNFDERLVDFRQRCAELKRMNDEALEMHAALAGAAA